MESPNNRGDKDPSNHLSLPDDKHPNMKLFCHHEDSPVGTVLWLISASLPWHSYPGKLQSL